MNETQIETKPDYGWTRRFERTPLAVTRSRITNALSKEGFGILTEIDVQATLKKKLGKDVPPFVILGACNPVLADRALAADPGIGLLLPCNVTLRDDGDGGTVVSVARPDSMFAIVGRADVEPIARDAGERLLRALKDA